MTFNEIICSDIANGGTVTKHQLTKRRFVVINISVTVLFWSVIVKSIIFSYKWIANIG